MARPRSIDLEAAEIGWRQVPMPGSNLPLDLVPLESDGAAFSILGRFPAGFVRDTPGGYLAAEEFVVLDGYLDLESVRYQPGTLVHVPANQLRTDMRAPEGCTVLAWFGGPAEFLAPKKLASTDAPIRSVLLTESHPGVVLESTEATWTLGDPANWKPGTEGISLLGVWARSAADWPKTASRPALLFRTPA